MAGSPVPALSMLTLCTAKFGFKRSRPSFLFLLTSETETTFGQFFAKQSARIDKAGTAKPTINVYW